MGGYSQPTTEGVDEGMPAPPNEWQYSAACAQIDPFLWFPEKGGSGYGEARQICNECPVVAECLKYALETERSLGDLSFNAIHGMYGGVTPNDRHQMHQQWRKVNGLVFDHDTRKWVQREDEEDGEAA